MIETFPKILKPGRYTQPCFYTCCFAGILQGNADVVAFLIRASKPFHLLMTHKLAFDLFGELKKVVQMLVLDVFFFAGFVKSLARILPNHFEQMISSLASCILLHQDKRFRHELCHPIQYLKRLYSVSSTDSFSRIESPTACKYGQSPQQDLFRLR